MDEAYWVGVVAILALLALFITLAISININSSETHRLHLKAQLAYIEACKGTDNPVACLARVP